MSVSKWQYTEQCEGRPCPGDCDCCDFDPDTVTITPPTVDYKINGKSLMMTYKEDRMDYVKDGTLTIQARTIEEVNKCGARMRRETDGKDQM